MFLGDVLLTQINSTMKCPASFAYANQVLISGYLDDANVDAAAPVTRT
jgi:hypothetical protein